MQIYYTTIVLIFFLQKFESTTERLLQIFPSNTIRTVRELSYFRIENFFYCAKYLNKSDEIGCSSSRSGNSGLLQELESWSDLELIEKSPEFINFIIFSDYLRINPELFAKAIKIPNVKGILKITKKVKFH